VLYLVLGWLLSRTIGNAGWWWMLAAGISHIVQSNHVEVQRRSYQWWVYGTTWIRHTHKAEGSATKKSLFGGFVSAYLALASGMTPHAARIDAAMARVDGDTAERARIAAVVRAEAPPLLAMCKWLGPNPRAVVLGLSMLALGGSGKGPLGYFVYQTVFLNLLLVASVWMHNAANRRMADAIEGGAHD
jgi:hypothetical protein